MSFLRKSTEYKLQNSTVGAYMWGTDKNTLLRKWAEAMSPRIPNMDYDKNISLLVPQEEPKSAEVILSVTGYLKCQVSGTTEEECRKLASQAFENADFGPLENVDAEVMSQIEFTASHFNRVYWALDNFKQWLTFIQLVKYAPSRWDAAVVSEADEFQKFLDSELLRLVEHVAIFHETFTEANAHTIREFELVEKNILKLDEKGMPENLGRAFSHPVYYQRGRPGRYTIRTWHSLGCVSGRRT